MMLSHPCQDCLEVAIGVGLKPYGQSGKHCCEAGQPAKKKTEVNGIKTYIKHNMTTTHFIELTIEKINSFLA